MFMKRVYAGVILLFVLSAAMFTVLFRDNFTGFAYMPSMGGNPYQFPMGTPQQSVISNAVTLNCNDPDRSINNNPSQDMYTKTTLTITDGFGSTIRSATDTCSNSLTYSTTQESNTGYALLERICLPNSGQISTTRYNCPQGYICNTGKCVTQTQTTNQASTSSITNNPQTCPACPTTQPTSQLDTQMPDLFHTSALAIVNSVGDKVSLHANLGGHAVVYGAEIKAIDFTKLTAEVEFNAPAGRQTKQIAINGQPNVVVFGGTTFTNFDALDVQIVMKSFTSTSASVVLSLLKS